MLEDRFYMRRPSFGRPRPATITLLIVNVVAFVVQILRYGYPPQLPAGDYFALSVEGLRHGYVWQLFTFQFMHGSLPHLLFNCLAIYVFGREVEEALGRKSFLTLYFSSGVVGGLCHALSGVLFPGQFGGSVVGASAGAFGLTAAFAMLFPEQVLLLFLVIPLRAKYLLLLSLLVAVLGIVLPSKSVDGPRIADAAHLGGMLTGLIFVRYAVHWHWPRFKRAERPPLRRLVKVHSQPSTPWGQNQDIVEEDLPAEEFLSKEVDPILDKISAQGIQSLTDRERRILESARQKMGKR